MSVKFDFFHQFFEDLRMLFLFNSIEQKQDGLTFYDLTQNGEFPAARMYRLMKKLEDEGYLIRHEKIESGRPKYLFTLSDQGIERLTELRAKVGENFDLVQSRFPETREMDKEKLLTEGTFKIWRSPLEHILQGEGSDEDKLIALQEMESNLTNIIKKVQNEIMKLKRKLKSKEKNQESDVTRVRKMNSVSMIFKYWMKNKKAFWISFSFQLAVTICALISPVLLGWLIGSIATPPDTLAKWNITEPDYLIIMLISIAVLGFFSFILGRAERIKSATVSAGGMYYLPSDIHDAIYKQSFSYFDKHETGQLVARAIS